MKLIQILSSTIAIIIAMTLCTLVSAQVIQEVELRPDGIVIPRLETTSVMSPTEGQIVYQSSDDTIYFFDGTEWLPVGSGSQISDADGDTRVTVELSLIHI